MLQLLAACLQLHYSPLCTLCLQAYEDAQDAENRARIAAAKRRTQEQHEMLQRQIAFKRNEERKRIQYVRVLSHSIVEQHCVVCGYRSS